MRLATRSRADIQGLRAVAVLLVALNHARVPFLEGGYVGVDVFFVLSGYLITGVLVRSAEEHRASESGMMSFFMDFYAHRARRILPAAALTLLVVDLVSSHWLNLVRAHQVLVDSVWSAFFAANVHFAHIGTDYFAQSQPPSPLQHFWSLAVEEQFYLLWPVLVAAVLLGGRRSRKRATVRRERSKVLTLVAASLVVASVAYSIIETHSDPAAAYFSTFARAWELGLGVLLSLSVARVARLPASLLAAAGWAGLASIVAASTLFSAATPFPGVAALLPAFGAAALIGSAIVPTESWASPAKVLSLWPLRFIGDRSFGFYLWHWPFLVLAAEIADKELSVAQNLGLLAAAFAVSMATYSFFENPIRRSPRLKSGGALALWPAAILVVLLGVSLHWADYRNELNFSAAAPSTVATTQLLDTPSESTPEAQQQRDANAFIPQSPSAVVAAAKAATTTAKVPASISPSPVGLTKAMYFLPPGCIAQPQQRQSKLCTVVPGGQKSMLVLGDSHAQMWMPAITAYARRYGYRVKALMQFGCNPWRWAGPGRTPGCGAWHASAVKQVRAAHADLLLVVTHYNVSGLEANITKTGPESTQNFVTLGASIRSSARRIVVLGDPPGQTKEPTDCLLRRSATMKTCSSFESDVQTATTASIQGAAEGFGAKFLDTTPWLCHDSVCPMVVGHTATYADHDHITEAYAEAVTPLFVQALRRLATASSSHA